MQKNNIKYKGCSSCKKLLGTNNFFKSKTQPDGFQSNCKDCNRGIAKNWYRNADKTKTKISSRKTMLKSKYGISLDEYERILKSQNGVCAICGLKETVISNKKGGVDSLRVDHCHTTGVVRGLLCSECNFGISKFDDKLSVMVSAVSYLLKHKQNETRTK